jgi:hypothetical protein
MEDGFPGRQDPTGIRLQPIYGVYVLNDYLKQYIRRPSPQLIDAISLVADACVRRMSEHQGTLVFWYEPDPNFARLYARHYSGLTQAYYAVSLHRAGQVLDTLRFQVAAAQVFDSLLVPTSLGGVHQTDARGVTVAEVPQQPHSWILNGWQSVLISVLEYARLANSAAARELFDASAETMASMLPLFDVPKWRNTRYGLSGFLYCRLRFSRPVAAVRHIAVEVPGEGVIPVERARTSRWRCYTFERDIDAVGTPAGRMVRMNLVLSRSSHPLPNLLRMRLQVSQPTTMTLEVQVGDYSPTSSAPVKQKWKRIASHDLASGEHLVTTELPWGDELELIGYPTNFLKKIDGRQTNVYHPVHIQRLRQLYAATGMPSLAHWAEVWSSYVCDWSTIRMYRGLAVRDYSGVADVVTAAEYCRRNVLRTNRPEGHLARHVDGTGLSP